MSRVPTGLLGRTREELVEAMTWLTWYAQGTYTAVMAYSNGELLPDRESAVPGSPGKFGYFGFGRQRKISRRKSETKSLTIIDS
jgi:hypothetical protein